MRFLATLVSLSLMTTLVGCGSVVIQANPDTDAGAADVPIATDRPPTLDTPLPPVDRPPSQDVPGVCTTTADCRAGLECLGGEGCAIPWTCQPALGRPCTDDLAPFCGCNGVTFYGSSTCPARPFAFRGECGIVPPPVDAGPAACALPDGRTCAVGDTCRIGECSTCFCAAPGALRCTGTCVDAGPPLRTCRGNVDCAAGEMCTGPEGCAIPWTCRPAPPCTRDLATYCACNGSTFMASSTCPGQPYLHRGNCGIVPPPVDAGVDTCVIDGVTCTIGVPCRVNACTTCTCLGDTVGCSVTPGCAMDGGAVDAGTDPPPLCAAQDARGVGNCAAFFGYAWDGSACVGLGGCSCVGADCRSLSLDQMACELAHRLCPRPI
jgi:hypothetical protein